MSELVQKKYTVGLPGIGAWSFRNRPVGAVSPKHDAGDPENSVENI